MKKGKVILLGVAIAIVLGSASTALFLTKRVQTADRADKTAITQRESADVRGQMPSTVRLRQGARQAIGADEGIAAADRALARLEADSALLDGTEKASKKALIEGVRRRLLETTGRGERR